MCGQKRSVVRRQVVEVTVRVRLGGWSWSAAERRKIRCSIRSFGQGRIDYIHAMIGWPGSDLASWSRNPYYLRPFIAGNKGRLGKNKKSRAKLASRTPFG
jgi:hypothetical protein